MEPTYKKISDEEIEVTVYQEKKFTVKRTELEAQKAAIEKADTKQIDELLTKFTTETI